MLRNAQVGYRLFLINTGLQAGDHARSKQKDVLTASFIFPAQAVALDELFQLLRKRTHAMTFFLVCDVSCHPFDSDTENAP